MVGRTLAICAALIALGLGLIVGAAPAAATTGRASGLYVGGTALPVVSSDIRIDVELGVARGTVTQRFHNPRPDAVEAVYVFPLPPGAAVDSLSATFAGQTVRGAIARRAEAAAAYQDAVADGRAAALVEQERPGVFTQSLAPIPAGGEVVVTLTWQATLVRHDGAWELVHPLVVGPRFVPGAATGRPTQGVGVAVDTNRAPDASRVTPPSSATVATPYRVELRLDDAVDLGSPTHPLAVAPQATGAVATVADAVGDRELVVRWRSAAAEQVRAIVEPAGGGAYVAVLVEPAAAPVAPPRGPRRWVVALDRSPSLAGVGDAMVRAVGRATIARLPAGDRAAVVTLGATPTGFTDDRAALARGVDAAPRGTADLTRALATSLGRLARTGPVEVVLITDGLIADDAAAIERAAATGLTIHTIAIGAAPNRWLLSAIAARTGGVARAAVTIDEVDAAVDAVVAADRQSPVTVDWRTPAVIDTEASAPRVGPGQAALLVAVEPGGVPSGEIEIAIGPRRLRARLERRPAAGLASTWARLRVARLYAAGDRVGATQVALERGVIAPTTALVATATRASEPVRSVISVTVPVPAGMRTDAVRDERFDDAERDDDRGDGQVDDRFGGDQGGGGRPAPAPADEDATATRVDRAPMTATLSGAAASEAQAMSPLDDGAVAPGGLAGDRRRVWVLGLSLGARLDREVPAAVADLGVYWRLPRTFAVGLRLAAVAAPLDDDPVAAAATVGLATASRLPVSLSFGVGLGWSGGLGVAYDAGLVFGRGGLGAALRLHGLAGPVRAETLSLGVEAAF
jgi:Ca-activated chloride channel family protein